MTTLAQRFRQARLHADIGLKEAAAHLGRGISTIIRIERGAKLTERSRIQAEEWIKRNSPKPKEGV